MVLVWVGSDTTLTPPRRGSRLPGMIGALYGEDDERGGLVPDGSFLGGVDARRGRWRDAALDAKGTSPQYFWTGRGRDALEVAYGTAAASSWLEGWTSPSPARGGASSS